MNQGLKTEANASATNSDIERCCVSIVSGAHDLLGWLHLPATIEAERLVVICNPLGTEYMSAHRSIRHLADKLARNGIATLRFDYAYQGDSSAGDFSHARLSDFIDNIGDAVSFAQTRSGMSATALIGIGLGSTFAALAAKRSDIDSIVLWNPTVSGKRYIREQKLLSEVLRSESPQAEETIDSAGIFLTQALQQDFQAINLLQHDWASVSHSLLISRDDMKANDKLAAKMTDAGTVVSHRIEAGYREMMDSPTDTVVPTDSLELITGWVKGSAAKPAPRPSPPHATDSLCELELRIAVDANDHARFPLVERAVHFGHQQHLFGIATETRERTAKKNSGDDGSYRAYVFLNCGSEHHAGPHRLYTILSRLCTSDEAMAFRLDIEGIGDSFSMGNNADNYSYSPIAIQDIDAALQFLTEKFGCTEFVVSGICAGAFHSFRAIAELSEHNIIEANLVNPLLFERNYDKPDTEHRYKMHTYRRSIRDPKNWRRLFTGDIQYRRLWGSLWSHGIELCRRKTGKWYRKMTDRKATGLVANLQSIRAANKRVNLILSEGDPGLDILQLSAPDEAKGLRSSGQLTVQSMHNANHGLSKKSMQDQLIAIFTDRYC